MSRCRRFEEEALLRIEQGLPLDEHFSTCPDCLAARETYDRLRAGIATLGAEVEPPARWQPRVWEEIERRRARRWPWGWRPVVLAGGLAAALVAVVLVGAPEGRRPVGLDVEVQAAAVTRRGVEALPGDRLVLRAQTGGAAHAELRVYRNDRELLLRCSGEPPCARRGGTLRAELALDVAGRYQPLLLAGERPFPVPTGELDADAAAAAAAGAEVAVASEVVVR